MVSGDLTFKTAGALLERGEQLLDGCSEAVIDLREAGACDSAGLALLLEWLDRGRQRGLEIRFRHLPDSLIRIAHLSNLGPLLPRADD